MLAVVFSFSICHLAHLTQLQPPDMFNCKEEVASRCYIAVSFAANLSQLLSEWRSHIRDPFLQILVLLQKVLLLNHISIRACEHIEIMVVMQIRYSVCAHSKPIKVAFILTSHHSHNYQKCLGCKDKTVRNL